MGRKQLNPELSQPQLVKEIIRLQDRRSRRVKILTTVSALLVVAAMAVLAATLWFPVLLITGESMAPLLQNGHVVITQRTQELQRGDLAAFYHENRILVKRVIADSGDWVDIDDDGNVSVNGEMLDEEYLQKAVLKPSNLSYP